MLIYIFSNTQGVSKKFQDWYHTRFISNPNYRLQVFPFKVISLESHALPHPSLPHLRDLEGFFQDPPHLRHHNLFVVHVFNMGPLYGPL